MFPFLKPKVQSTWRFILWWRSFIVGPSNRANQICLNMETPRKLGRKLFKLTMHLTIQQSTLHLQMHPWGPLTTGRDPITSSIQSHNLDPESNGIGLDTSALSVLMWRHTSKMVKSTWINVEQEPSNEEQNLQLRNPDINRSKGLCQCRSMPGK